MVSEGRVPGFIEAGMRAVVFYHFPMAIHNLDAVHKVRKCS